jgi:hypothetical protein
MTEPKSTPQRGWRFIIALVVLLGLVLAQRRWLPADNVADNSTRPSTRETVSLLIDRGDGAAAKTHDIGWCPGQTVLGVLEAYSAEHPDEPLSVVGSGASALVTAAAGRSNEGAGGLNWQFELNGQYGTKSAGVTPVQAGDRVLWKFALFQ